MGPHIFARKRSNFGSPTTLLIKSSSRETKGVKVCSSALEISKVAEELGMLKIEYQDTEPAFYTMEWAQDNKHIKR
ncbi:MAG: hypothetical protein H0V70_21175 [Ktedonobacteraceae bacterium]|nr:hypothetical protein [Ktedonobacteraceae bacterium]